MVQNKAVFLVRWFVIVILWTAAVIGAEAESGFPVIEGVRLCQTYRLKEGVATKVGKPKPCREKKKVFQLSQNLRGGSSLPQ